MILQGKITGYDGRFLTISAPFDNPFDYIKKGYEACEIRLDDGRTISADQRKKIYATLRDISLYTGYIPEEVKELMKYQYIAKTGGRGFSLSDCDMTTAKEFLNFLIDFCLEWNIPAQDSLRERSPDITQYVYSCLIHQRCAVCGGKAELHHVDKVQMGRDRTEIIHQGMKVEPLCRIHHTQAHDMGQQTFDSKYQLQGIGLDKDLCRIWRVKACTTKQF